MSSSSDSTCPSEELSCASSDSTCPSNELSGSRNRSILLNTSASTSNSSTSTSTLQSSTSRSWSSGSPSMPSVLELSAANVRCIGHSAPPPTFRTTLLNSPRVCQTRRTRRRHARKGHGAGGGGAFLVPPHDSGLLWAGTQAADLRGCCRDEVRRRLRSTSYPTRRDGGGKVEPVPRAKTALAPTRLTAGLSTVGRGQVCAR
mmetsp:Transcript_22042/g.35675  ORF Transcript_22042/g.35675 Transcript_22042/m.35675 type:complete len:202 (-) Transcript_22042:20-625(-)